MDFLPKWNKKETIGSPNQHRGFGCIKNKWDPRDYQIGSIIGEELALPPSFRLPDQFPCKDQNGFGSCTAQATSSHKEKQEGVRLSARALFAMTKKYEGNMNWGANTRNAFKILCDNGAIEESVYPERHDITEKEYMDWNNLPADYLAKAMPHKSLKYWFIGSVDMIKQSIYQYKQSVVMSVPWYVSYNRPKENGELILDGNQGWKYGHAIEVVGWKDNDWLLIKNSWGNDWGLNGYCYFYKTYSWWDAIISLDMPATLPVELRYGQKRTTATYLREKAMVAYWTPKLRRLPTSLEINGAIYGGWDAMTLFKGTNGNIWLHKPKATAIKDGFQYKYIAWK